jgi:hypothetical protein
MKPIHRRFEFGLVSGETLKIREDHLERVCRPLFSGLVSFLPESLLPAFP